ncbi:MAG: cbb3-type cytochrome oxidase assembly protein CcoS [Saccharospirillum sp.]|uniref:cbb3-type cytochrome oxidase assembly protein CcoS n=1 Tax=Saccharospirillum sp. TaxID=2033801 RepID=UPI003299F39B
MDILLLLIPVSLLLLLLGGGLFWWTVNSGQYDDLDSPAQRILFDDDSDMVPDRPDRSRSGNGPAKPVEPVTADQQDSSTR